MKKILSGFIILTFLASVAYALTYSDSDIFNMPNQFDTTKGIVVDEDGNLSVSGTITGTGFSPSGNLGVGGNLTVTGTSTLTGAVGITGATTHTGAITASGAELTISTHTTFSDANVYDVGTIELDNIYGDGNAIVIGDGGDTVTINPTTETTFSDKNITNVGSISLDSITGDANAIAIGDGGDTITVNPTTATTFSDKNITNVGDISLDTISSDAGTSVGVTLGSDAGDDFNVGSGKLVVEGDSGNVGIGIAAPAYLLQTSGGDVSFTNNKTGIGYVHQYNTNQTAGIKCIFQQNVQAGSSQIYKTLSGSWYFVNNDTETATGFTAFSTRSTERVRITADGNVGIDDQTPTSLLDVNGDIGIEGITLDGDSTNYELDISSNINVLGRIKLGEKSAVELRALDPVAVGEIWLNTDTNHIFQSTGTTVGQYVDISDYTTAP